MKRLIFFIYLFFYFTQSLVAQTQLEKGDIVVLGINYNSQANNGDPEKSTACSINSISNFISDLIYLVPLKDISSGMSFIITDNGFEREYSNYWGTTEGVIKFELKNGYSFNKGEVIELKIPGNSNSLSFLSDANPKWNTTILQGGAPLNLTKQDQLIIFSGNTTWSAVSTPLHKGTLTGNYLYAFNTVHNWVKLPAPNNTETQNSVLPGYNNTSIDINNIAQNDLRRHHFTPNEVTNPKEFSFSYYNGIRTATSKNQWLIRLMNPNNWKRVNNCTEFQDNMNKNNIDVIEQLEKESCVGIPFSLEIELDNLVPGQSIQTKYKWFRTTSLTNTGVNIGNMRNLPNYTENSVGTYYYYCEITYQLKWNNCETNQSNCTSATSTNVVKSGYIKAIIKPLPKISPIEMN